MTPDTQNPEIEEEAQSGTRRMRVYRAEEGVELSADIMRHEGITPVEAAARQREAASGLTSGHFVRVLFRDEHSGMSVAYAWFKPNYVLPRHSHDVDCLYHVISGSISLGSEVIGPGDGFFVPADVNYTYAAGSEGVELVEFRTATTFNMIVSNPPQAWQKILDVKLDHRDVWREAEPPPAAVRMGARRLSAG